MSKEDQIKLALSLLAEHGGFERSRRILVNFEKNMEYRKSRQRDIYRDAMKYRAQEKESHTS